MRVWIYIFSFSVIFLSYIFSYIYIFTSVMHAYYIFKCLRHTYLSYCSYNFCLFITLYQLKWYYYRGVYRTLSNIYGRVIAINYFYKKFHHWYLIRSEMRGWVVEVKIRRTCITLRNLPVQENWRKKFAWFM